MNEETRKDVHDLTNDELRREIAEALGYTEEPHPYWDGWSRILDPGGKPVREDRNRDGWTKYPWSYDCYFPNWPKDDGAAFRLVISVKDMLNVRYAPHKYVFTVDDCPLLYSGTYTSYIPEVTRAIDARALSELAALALRQMGGAR